MDSDNIQLNAENFNLDFLVDNEIVPEVQVLDAYKILIVDDEKEMHTSTQMLLKDFYFEGRGLELISAYTGSDAKSIIAGDPDIAVVFLDVVMEENNSGLQVVEYIRKILKN